MIDYIAFDHMCVCVDDIDKAVDFYCKVMGAKKVSYVENWKNPGFARAAGILDHAEIEKFCISVALVQVPANPPLNIEIIRYFSPMGKQVIPKTAVNDLGGPNHLCFRVKNIDEAFDFLKAQPGITMANTSPQYRPHKLDTIDPCQIKIHDKSVNPDERCKEISHIQFFYFVDPYGVRWELLQIFDGE